MVRYHYREGVTFDKKKSRWFLIFVGLIIIAAAVYVGAVYLAPQLVTIPFTRLTVDATDNKIKNSKAGEFGDHLFLPQINVDVAINAGGNESQLETGVWQRNTSLGDPEKGGHMVLSGRKFTWDMTPQWARAKSPFFNLSKLNIGDDLTLDYHGKRYVYQVDKTTQVEAGANPEQKSDGFRLTLYATDGQGNSLSGPVVSAKRISPVTQAASNN